MTAKLSLLVEHYHKTYDLAYRIWESRNRTFLYLIGTVAIAVLLIAYPPLGELLMSLAARKADVDGLVPAAEKPPELDALVAYASSTLLNGMFLMAVFFLMSNLLKDTLNIIRLYKYIDGLEREINLMMDLGAGSIAFTRESSFYWKNRQLTHVLVKFFYVLMLLVLLGVFLALRLWKDLPPGPDHASADLRQLAAGLPFLLDVVIGLPIVILFLGYAKASLWSDVKPERRP